MENTTRECERRVPPRSKFNDEEATGVLRLIIEQEKLLKNASASPVLNISSNRLKRLPPLQATQRSESLDETEFENARSRKTSNPLDPGSEIFLSKPTLLKGKDFRTFDENGTLPGKPSRVPDIYSSPKMVRHRERPRGSYGRSQGDVLTRDSSGKSRSLDSCANLRISTADFIMPRPSNPIPKDELENHSNGYSPTGEEYEKEEDELESPLCPAPPKIYSPPSYIN